MFSRWIVTNITSARGTLHCRKTRIPCVDQVVICGLYVGVKGQRFPGEGVLDTIRFRSFFLRCYVLTAEIMKMTAFWDTSLCTAMEVDRRFRGTYCPSHRPDVGVIKNQ
jgi:hypothetical protein